MRRDSIILDMIPDIPVAITGIGCLCGAGMNLQECMDSIYRGERNPAPPEKFTTDHPLPYPVFEIKRNLPIDKADDASDILRTSLLAISAAKEALNDAGYTDETLSGKRVGVCLGTTVGSAINNESFYREYRKGIDPALEEVSRFFRSNPASCVSKHFRLNGPRQTIVNACSSGTDAIGIGASWIKSGICDFVIAGGADELCRITYNGFASLMIIDSSPCRPFNVDRNGLNLGEGAAVLILESEEMVRKRNKPVRGYVSGYGSACDAYHLTTPEPDGAGLRKALSSVFKSGSIAPEDIAFVNAHGTGTKNNDHVESLVLGDFFPGVPFNSTKGYTGHTLGASGAIEAAFTIACLENGMIPSSTWFTSGDPDVKCFPVKKNTQINGRIAISQSLAFGGNNSILMLGIGEY